MYQLRSLFAKVGLQCGPREAGRNDVNFTYPRPVVVISKRSYLECSNTDDPAITDAIKNLTNQPLACRAIDLKKLSISPVPPGPQNCDPVKIALVRLQQPGEVRFRVVLPPKTAEPTGFGAADSSAALRAAVGEAGVRDGVLASLLEAGEQVLLQALDRGRIVGPRFRIGPSGAFLRWLRHGRSRKKARPRHGLGRVE